MAAWSAWIWAARLATSAVRWSSSCWVALPCLDSVAVRSRSCLALVRLAWSCASLATAWPRAAWNGAGSICTSRSPCCTIWPSSKPTFSICPSTRERTVTVLVACTVPSPVENDRKRLRLHGRDVNGGSLLSCSCLRRRAAGSEVLPAPVRCGDARQRHQRPTPPSQPTLGPLRVLAPSTSSGFIETCPFIQLCSTASGKRCLIEVQAAHKAGSEASFCAACQGITWKERFPRCR